MSQALVEPPSPPPATEAQIRAAAARLVELAAAHGIHELAYASPGRLLGRVDEDHDLFDVFEFQRAATGLLGRSVEVFSTGALGNAHVSPDLIFARAL